MCGCLCSVSLFYRYFKVIKISHVFVYSTLKLHKILDNPKNAGFENQQNRLNCKAISDSNIDSDSAN